MAFRIGPTETGKTPARRAAAALSFSVLGALLILSAAGCRLGKNPLSAFHSEPSAGEAQESVPPPAAKESYPVKSLVEDRKASAPRAANWEQDEIPTDDVVTLSYYENVASQVRYEDGDSDTFGRSGTRPPPRLREPQPGEIRRLSLAEALQLAIVNNEIIRVDGEFLSPRSTILQDVSRAASVFDVALQDSGFLFGRRGELAASSDFAPQISGGLVWRRDENVQNNLFLAGGLRPGDTLYEESAAFTSRIEKVFATGGTAALNMNWNYSLTNQQARLFGSVYTGTASAEFRQPLVAGFGPDFNLVAGPLGRTNTAITGVTQGIVIARINTDISVVQFEADVRNLVYDVQQVYWDLSAAFNRYSVQRDISNRLKEIWDKVLARNKFGIPQGGTADEAQAADNYYESRASAKQALADMYEAEGRLRRLLGLPASDGTVLRPSDLPREAEFQFDWEEELGNALVNRLELRRTKMTLRSLELQLRAAKNLARPRVDFVSAYRVNAFGDRFFASNDNDNATSQGLRSAVETLFQGNQTGWNLGFQVSMPLGFRAERAQIRNIRVQLAKTTAGLAAQEQEISYELRNAVMQLQRWYAVLQLSAERKRAAERRVAAFEADYDAGRASLDLLLRSRISSSEASVAFYQALAQYNKAIANFYFRAGTMLERNGIRIRDGVPTFESEPLPSGATLPVPPLPEPPSTPLSVPPAPPAAKVKV